MFGELKKAIKVKRDNITLMEVYQKHWDSAFGNNKRQRDSDMIGENNSESSLKSRRLGGIDWSSISSFAGV